MYRCFWNLAAECDVNLNLRAKFNAELATDFATKCANQLRAIALFVAVRSVALNLRLRGVKFSRGSILRGCILYRRVRAAHAT